MNPYKHQKPRRGRRVGQTLVLFVLFITVLILFVGLGVDLGFAYITKAQLSKATDAACLAGLSYLSQGTITASSMAVSAFRANYGSPGRDAGSITPNVSFGTSAGNNRTITVTATTQINTFFIRVLPQWKTLSVGDTAQAIRANLIMTLVLDRSQSMDPTCFGTGCSQGGIYLPGAVRDFINDFDDNVDQAAVVSFGSSVTNNVSMRRPFKSAVISAANSLLWEGYTFSHGGLTNALAINNAVSVPAGQTAVKVVVFFTDGMANMIQNTLTTTSGANANPCTTPGTQKAWNFGTILGQIVFFNTNAPITQAGQGNPVCTGCCGGNNKFRSIDGTLKSFSPDNIVSDATNRCIQVANQMRAAGMYVYAIGLDNGGVDAVTASFLQQVANDPDSPTYDPNQPVGVAMITGNGADLPQLFQQIAGDIIMRLTQ